MEDKTITQKYSNELIDFSNKLNKIFENISDDMKLTKNYVEKLSKEILELKNEHRIELLTLKKDISLIKSNLTLLKNKNVETDKTLKKDKAIILKNISDLTTKIIRVENKLKIK